MYSDEWEPAMTADSMDERINELAKLAQKRADEREESLDDVVHNMVHDAYLMKHTTQDALSELNDLQDLYPNEFYNGEANDHIMMYINDDLNFEFWFDYVYLALSAGLEWAVLNQLRED